MEGLTCLHKVHRPHALVPESDNRPTLVEDEEQENEMTTDDASSVSNKKTDEVAEIPLQSGYVWRFSSGLVSTTASALGLGVNGVKWVVGKGYSAGSAVVGTTKTVVCKVPLPALQKKDKKE
jgi:hypothetical protein